MFSQFSFKSLDDTPAPAPPQRSQPIQPQNQDRHEHEIHASPFIEEDDYDSFHSDSGFGSGRQSRTSLTALAEDDEDEVEESKEVSDVIERGFIVLCW
ncbi:uncharacterized protein IL334_001778 [Kwoniella shivajii]|uniref:Uncharacterized protein n=1 Tax=Kwoniella shivajii TaxID=564305 RepID=A0ABZ1CX22_9TREE|nr:hypothetical protein IL334_001778 [Kwoniella shivajii]